MANDPPTNLRMGFGYEQARAAGLGGVRADRSPRQVNKIVEQNKIDRKAVQELREAAADPEWAPLIEHRVGEKRTAEQIAEEIYWIKRYSAYRAQGYSAPFCREKHYR